MDLINEAIACGKFSASRRPHYERLLAADPLRTRRLIESLQSVPGLVSCEPVDSHRGVIASSAGLPVMPHPSGGYYVERS